MKITFESFLDEHKKIVMKCYNNFEKDVILDMYIDSLEKADYDFLIQNIVIDKKGYEGAPEQIMLFKSLQRGGFLLEHDERVYYYNYFDDIFIPKDKQTNLSDDIIHKLHTSLHNAAKNMANDTLIGFSDLKDSVLPVVKIKNQNVKNSSGSICTQTSSFKSKNLKELSDTIKPFEKNPTDLNKKELCKIYEYLLRVHNKYQRYPHYKNILYQTDDSNA
jgi:hypothetical protein